MAEAASPPWWLMIRRIVIFLLGVLVIIDSLLEKQTASVGKLIVGLIMVGVLPLDDLLALVSARQAHRLTQPRHVDDGGSSREP